MSALPYEIQNDALTKLIAQVDQLAVLPHVVFKVLEVTGNEDSPAQEMERVITVDPGFSSKVLVMANSAAFGLPKKVSSIREAISFLGVRTLRTIALTVGVFDLFVGKTDRESLRRRGWWRQSIDAALCAKWVAKETKVVSPDDAYTCGLLHLIGKTLLDRFGGMDYEMVQHMIEIGMRDDSSEAEVFGCSHAEVSAAAAQKWGLPPTLVSGLLYTTPAEADDESGAIRACTALAASLARMAKDGAADPATDLPAWAMLRLGLPKDRATELLEHTKELIANAETGR